MSKTLQRLLIASTAAALLGAAPAMAHKAREGGDPAQHHQRMEQRLAERQQKLKADLKLTPAQESAWTRYTDAFKRPAQPAQRPDRDAMARMTTPERLDQMQARKAERDAHMNRIVEATRALYAALSPEQQKVFDQQSPMARGPHPHGQAGGHGHHGKG